MCDHIQVPVLSVDFEILFERPVISSIPCSYGGRTLEPVKAEVDRR